MIITIDLSPFHRRFSPWIHLRRQEVDSCKMGPSDLGTCSSTLQKSLGSRPGRRAGTDPGPDLGGTRLGHRTRGELNGSKVGSWDMVMKNPWFSGKKMQKTSNFELWFETNVLVCWNIAPECTRYVWIVVGCEKTWSTARWVAWWAVSRKLRFGKHQWLDCSWLGNRWNLPNQKRKQSVDFCGKTIDINLCTYFKLV